MQDRIKIGIVGGGFSREFAFDVHPGCEVVAVAEWDSQRRQQMRDRYRCDVTYETLEELLQDRNMHAVCLFTPAPEHARHSIAALKAGKHVLCAVPAAFTLEECQQLLDTVRATGQIYMMAETNYYRQEPMLVREWYREGRFGEVFYTECEYWHEHLDRLMFHADGTPTWRYGLPPMHYPTHCVAFLTGITGERLTRVQCVGWSDESEILKNNVYGNPFWNEIGFFQTDRGHCSRMLVGWHVGHPEVERATWYGSAMSFIMRSPMGQPSACSVSLQKETVEVPNFHERLPEALRRDTGHSGAPMHLTHEFVSALQEERRPTVDIYEALAYTAPGIVAHRSALNEGEVLPIPDFGRAD